MPIVEKNKTNTDKCACPNCPSYNECAKGKTESLYCAKDNGKSGCEFKKNGCTCGDCPVHKENNLKSWYYCMVGSADEVDK